MSLSIMRSCSILAVAAHLVAFGSAATTADSTLCGQYDKYTTSNNLFTFNTDQWGADGSGGQCVTVSNDGTVFNATWNWSDNPFLVHSFPNINLNSELLPIQLSNLAALNMSVAWTMAPSDNPNEDLAAIDAAADVVVDMFLDPNQETANSTTLPKYEIMVWIAAFGGKKPIGYNSTLTNLPTYDLGGNNFTLYTGPNGNGQTVYSWLAPTNITNFNEDISPLIHYLWRQKIIDESNYLGIVQFGTEAFHSTSNVTFSAHNFNFTIHQGKPASATSLSSGRFLPNLGLLLLASALSLLVSV